jgi:hypothetical protein
MNELLEEVLDCTIESYEIRGTDENGRVYVRLSPKLFTELLRSGKFEGVGFINAHVDGDKNYCHRFAIGNVDYFSETKVEIEI